MSASCVAIPKTVPIPTYLNLDFFLSTFDSQHRLVDKTPIPNATVVTVDSESGLPLHAWGKNTFYMPHGITVDAQGSVYLTDAGAHQVYRVSETESANN